MSTHEPTQPQPEYLGPATHASGSDEPPTGRRRRRTGLVVGAAALLVAAVGAGAWGVAQLMSGGTSPATAVPADAVGYVSLDLDPSASQKIEAVKILHTFPGLRAQLHVGSRDDLRRVLFDAIRKDGGCTGLDYARDVEPWIGDRMAVAAVPDSTKGARPLLVLQVGDQDKARAGAVKLEQCAMGAQRGSNSGSSSGSGSGAAGHRAGIAFVGDYLLLAESQKLADAMAADATDAALADAPEFTTAMGRVGDPGIVSMYVSRDAPDAFLTAAEQSSLVAGGSADFTVVGGSGTAGLEKHFAAEQRKQVERFRRMFKDFQGAAGAVRFADGAVEAEVVGKGVPSGPGTDRLAPDVGTLPNTTAAVVSIGLRPGWLTSYLDRMGSIAGLSTHQMLAEAERQTGLHLPDDIETMLGTGVSLSVDGSADLSTLDSSSDPSGIPAGLRIDGDPARITPIIARLKKAAGPGADIVKVGSGDGVVAVGFDRAYVDSLLHDGGLGGTVAFQDVVPHPERAGGVVFVDLDAGNGWADQLAGGDARAKANLAPLHALGISAWTDGDHLQHGLLRLSTD